MRDPDRTSQRLREQAGRNARSPRRGFSRSSARGMKSEVARAQQVLQISRFLLQHVFHSLAYLSLGIRVTS
ncbi:hypothetical protein EAG_07776 [Camponotus floridanus]|uniref:Uncharacterized protein n=1 Tax=Camponotus floridanus TaxID=104421 RepID=E2ATW7_CAMFO|nr:hypothetical protein EAG_07776 [Camponotus floridanus]